MKYDFEGHFIEACDCFELCPCWVDDEPDEGHCTGLVAWRIDRGEIDGVDVSDRRVVAVTTHNGRRRTDGASTVLLIDDADKEPGDRFAALSTAFGSGDTALADLVQVTGRVVGVPKRTPITVEKNAGGWSVRVGSGPSPAVHAHGVPLSFDKSVRPMTLDQTALHKELHIQGSATAQRTRELKLVVPELGGSGYLDVSARSGMSGTFHYKNP